MATLISGSLAYDFVMDFPDSFKNHILPDQIHILNVCFVVEKLEKNFGGCAANIGYTMKLLGTDPLILGPVGKDAKEYVDFLKKHNIKTDYIPISKKLLTSSCHITTDKDDNQVIAYYNGAGNEAENLSIYDIKDEFDFAIISPTQKQAMIKHAKECYEKEIPFCFDPSHQLTAFTDQELMQVIGQAKFYVANDYEMKLTEKRTGWSEEKMLEHVDILIVTLGEQGSRIRTKDNSFDIAPCKPSSINDPTGAGDAYRAGFFSAYSHGHDYETCGQVGSVAATYAIEHYGTQNHSFTWEEFQSRYKDTYDEAIELKM